MSFLLLQAPWSQFLHYILYSYFYAARIAVGALWLICGFQLQWDSQGSLVTFTSSFYPFHPNLPITHASFPPLLVLEEEEYVFLFQANLYLNLSSPFPGACRLSPSSSLGYPRFLLSSCFFLACNQAEVYKNKPKFYLSFLFPASTATSFLSPPLLGNLQAHIPVIPWPPALQLLSHPSWVLQWPSNYQIQQPHFSPPLGIKTMTTDLFS